MKSPWGDLIRIAKQHQLEALLNLCVSRLNDNLSAANCTETLEIACKYDLRQIILKGLLFIHIHPQDFGAFNDLNRNLFYMKMTTQNGLIDLDVVALMASCQKDQLRGAKFNLQTASNEQLEVELLDLPAKEQNADGSRKLICPKQFSTFLFHLNALHPITLNTTRCFEVSSENIIHIHQTTGIKKYKVTTDFPDYDLEFINQLEQYGNKTAFLHTYAEAEKYVNLFVQSKCQLTDLNVRRITDLSNEKLQALVNKMPHLKRLYLNNDINITTLPNLSENVEVRWSLGRPARSSYSSDIYYLDIQSMEELERYISFYQLAQQEKKMNLHWDLRRLTHLTDEQLETLAKKVPHLKGLVTSSKKVTKIPFERLEHVDTWNKIPSAASKTSHQMPQDTKSNLSNSAAQSLSFSTSNSLSASGSFPKKLPTILHQQRLNT